METGPRGKLWHGKGPSLSAGRHAPAYSIIAIRVRATDTDMLVYTASSKRLDYCNEHQSCAFHCAGATRRLRMQLTAPGFRWQPTRPEVPTICAPGHVKQWPRRGPTHGMRASARGRQTDAGALNCLCVCGTAGKSQLVWSTTPHLPSPPGHLPPGPPSLPSTPPAALVPSAMPTPTPSSYWTAGSSQWLGGRGGGCGQRSVAWARLAKGDVWGRGIPRALCAARLAKKSAASGLSDRLGALPVLQHPDVHGTHAFNPSHASRLQSMFA